MKPVATAQWQMASGKQLYARELTDNQLMQACRFGLRSAQRHFQEEALDALAASAGGDDGLAYIAEVQSDTAMERAGNLQDLVRHMAKSLRFREVLIELRRRRARRQATSQLQLQSA